MQISVDELESSISVKISKEAVMSINSPDSLFTSVNGKLETKVYIAGLPNRTDNIIKPVRRSSDSMPQNKLYQDTVTIKAQNKQSSRNTVNVMWNLCNMLL